MRILLVHHHAAPCELEPHLRRLGPIRTVDDRGWPFRFPRTLSIARELAPEVILERGNASGLGALLSLALDVPLVTMVVDERWSWLSLHRAQRIVATDLGLVPDAMRDKTVTVRSAADTARFHPGVDGSEARARWGLDGRAVVAYAGSFQSWHGVPTLVDAARLLRDRVELRWLFAGDGPLRPAIQRRAEAMGVADRCVFTGEVPAVELPSVLAAADACVVPFDPELHPLARPRAALAIDPRAVFEALALGKPTITVRTAGLPALFRDGAEIGFVSPRDPGALAAAVEQVLDHPARASAMAAAGRQRVLARHSIGAHAERLVALMRSLLAEAA